MFNNERKRIPHLFRGNGAIFDSKLSMPAKVVHLFLSSRADFKDEAAPSLEDIAFHCGGLSLQAVKRALKELERTGWIKKQPQSVPNGKSLPSVYKLLSPTNNV